MRKLHKVIIYLIYKLGLRRHLINIHTMFYLSSFNKWLSILTVYVPTFVLTETRNMDTNSYSPEVIGRRQVVNLRL